MSPASVSLWSSGERSWSLLVLLGAACDGTRADSPEAAPSVASTESTLGDGERLGTASSGFCVEVAPDVPTTCELETQCGIGMFSSRVNGRWSVTNQGAGTLDYIPPAWGTSEDPPAATITVSEHPTPVLIAELNGHAVTYRPLPDEEFQGCA